MTAIFLAGAEVETLTRALLDNGVKSILYSYYYIHVMRRERFIEQIQREHPDVRFFLDSGAFTYWTKFRAEPEKLPHWRAFKAAYYKYIEGTWERWYRISELDLDNTFPEITLGLLAEWRDEALERWPTANFMPVWHGNRGPEEWTWYCRDKRFKCMAIGSGLPYLGLHRRMIIEAHRWNKAVHGFGMTRFNALRFLPYDTVDSTSWLMGQKFGTLFIFKDNEFKLLGKDRGGGKAARRLYKLYFKRIGCDPRLIIADDTAEVRKANILAWRRLSDRMEEVAKRQRRTIEAIYPDGVMPRLNETYPWGAPKDRADGDVTGNRPRERDPGEVGSRPLEREPGQMGERPRERTAEDRGDPKKRPKER